MIYLLMRQVVTHGNASNLLSEQDVKTVRDGGGGGGGEPEREASSDLLL